MEEQNYLVMDDTAEHWKKEHPNEYAALEDDRVKEIINAAIQKWKKRVTDKQ